jgi:hypothetical protein
MTLKELLDYLAVHPYYVVFYFTAIPLLALLAGWFDMERGKTPPWNYFYAVLIYGVCVPGIFAITLTVYHIFFAKKDPLELQVLTHLLPAASMILSLAIIRRNADLRYVPGFDRLSGLIFIISAVLCMMWISDRTRFVVFSYLRMEYVLLIFVGLLLLMRFGIGRLFGSPYRSRA